MWEGLMVSTSQCCRFAWWRFIIRVKWFHHIQCLKSTNMSVLYWLPEICIHVQNMTWNSKACNQIWQLWIHWQFVLLKKWQLSQTTHATIFTDSKNLLQKLQSKMRSPRLTGDNVWQPLLKAHVHVLPWTCWGWGKCLIRSVEEIETLAVGSKPRTWHHWSPGREGHRHRKCSMILLERTRKD